MIFHAADFPYYTFGSLDRCGGIRHFVTSCRQGALGDVNLRSPNGVENRRRLAASVGFNINRLTTAEQTHSLNIAVVNETNAGLGALTIDSRIPNTDALITNQPGVCIMVLTADCQSVLLYDADNRAVAAIHAGWRGTVQRIVEKSVQRMAEVYGTQPCDIIAQIGPGIHLESFEVGDEVYDAFAQAGFDMEPISRKFPQHDGESPSHSTLLPSKWHIDLPECNRLQMVKAGVAENKLTVSPVCTFKQSDMFFSARRLGINSGRIFTGILLR